MLLFIATSGSLDSTTALLTIAPTSVISFVNLFLSILRVLSDIQDR